MNKLEIKAGKTHSERAKIIAKTLGYFTAARYLAKRGWSVDAACYILLNK